MENVLNPEVRSDNNKKENFFESFKSLHWINKLFFISLSFLFIAIATNFKRHLAIDVTSFFAVCSLIKGRLNIKQVLLSNWPLFALALFAILKPYANTFCATFGFRAIAFFFIGLAAELHLSKIWHYSASLSSISITTMFILYCAGLYNPEDAFVADRLTLTMNPSSVLMGYVAFCSMVAGVQAVTKLTGKEKLFLIPSLCGCFVVMLFSATQTVFFGFIFCFIYWLYYFSKKKKFFFKTLIILSLIVVSLFFSPLCDNIFIIQRAKESLTNKKVFLHLSSRDVIWKATLDLFKEHPLFGTTDSYKEYNNYINNLKINGINPGSFYPDYNPHSIILSMLHYYGLIGMIIYLFMLFYSLKYAVKYNHLFFLSIIIFDLTCGMFNYHWGTTHGVFFTFLPMGNCFAQDVTDKGNVEQV